LPSPLLPLLLLLLLLPLPLVADACALLGNYECSPIGVVLWWQWWWWWCVLADGWCYRAVVGFCTRIYCACDAPCCIGLVLPPRHRETTSLQVRRVASICRRTGAYVVSARQAGSGGFSHPSGGDLVKSWHCRRLLYLLLFGDRSFGFWVAAVVCRR
jgi:hypothetical protein